MITDFEKIKEQLTQLAPIVNAFKSESVQAKLVELLLAHSFPVGAAGPSPTAGSTETETRRRPRARSKLPVAAPAASPAAAAAPPKRASRGGKGSFAIVSALVDDGFFKTPQTIGSIVDHCGTTKGHHFKANEVSPVLLRLLRDDKLTREKNSEGQYEYTEA